MIIYFAYYTFVCILGLKYSKIKSQKNKIFAFLFAFLFLFFICALRHPSMGIDLHYGFSDGYIGRFQYISEQNWGYLLKNHSTDYDLQSYEIGYVLFNKIISVFGNNSQLLLSFVALLSIFPIFVVYYKESNSFVFSILVYLAFPCFFAVFSALRQACAIGICFMSYKFIKERKIIPFILFILLASTFHITALVFLLSYPLYTIRIKKIYKYFMVVLVGIIFLFRNQIFILLMHLFNKGITPDNNGAINLFLFFIALYIVLSLISKENKELNGLMNILLLLVIIQCFGNVHSYITRIGYYFMPFLGLLIPKSIKNIKVEYRGICKITFICFFIGYGLFSIYQSGIGWAQAYPWIPFWKEI